VGFYLKNGLPYHNNKYQIKWKRDKYKTGDSIGIVVDMRTNPGKFIVIVNGVSLGVAFSNVTLPIFPCATLFNKGDSIVIEPFEHLPDF